MKKALSLLSVAFLLSGAMISVVSAKTIGVGADAGIDISLDASADGAAARANASANANANTQTKNGTSSKGSEQSTEAGTAASTTVRGNATSTAAQQRNDDRKGATTTRGEITSAEHRSTVATFVRSLLGLADREQGGIGEQVRVVAHEQEESSSTTASAMVLVESRSALKTFFLGGDYKNLGVIRSGIASTSAHLDQLTRMRDKASTEADKAELTAQINVLAQTQAQLDAYVEAHENTFSMFGWFVRLFAN